MLRRTHQCDRCGTAIEPGDVYAAIDGVDPDGELRVLLCRSCGRRLRAFLDGDTEESPDVETPSASTDDAAGDATDTAGES
jgi:hypothetical protein